MRRLIHHDVEPGSLDRASFITLPQTFLEMPRWWHEGADWLAALPKTVEDVCQRWNLYPDGPIMHGSNAIVAPVRRDGEPLALRMTFPDDRTGDEVRALRFWHGRGTVRIFDTDVTIGASLLERLDGGQTLAQRPLDEAVPIIAAMMRRLAIPAPQEVPSTACMVRDRMETMAPDWERLGEPFERSTLDAALTAAHMVSQTKSDLAVNGDLHCAQVLAATREPWLVVDPVLLRGDIEYDLARILWSRLDEMADDAEVVRWFEAIVDVAKLERERAHAWLLYRTVDYWLWGLDYGLTEDPSRCAQLARIFGNQ